MTGATGYAGGAIIHVIRDTLPQLNLTALVRTADQATLLQTTYPGIETVTGTLEDHDLLVSYARQADIVLHAANVDHKPGTLSLLAGLASKTSADKGTYIVLSGSGSLLDLDNLSPGLPASKLYSDVDDAEEIYNLPSHRIHVEIERQITREAEAAGVRAVILAPSQIFTTGIGVGKKESYLNEHPRAILDHGKAFFIGEGKNVWSWVSAEDMASAICLLMEESLRGAESRLEYGKNGYYYCQTGYLESREQAEAIRAELERLGAVSEGVESISLEEALRLNDYGIMLWGSSMLSKADKLRALGWKPKIEDWRPLVARAARLEFEARKSGKESVGEYQKV